MKTILNSLLYVAYALPVLALCWLIWSDLSHVDELKKARNEVAQLQQQLARTGNHQ